MNDIVVSDVHWADGDCDEEQTGRLVIQSARLDTRSSRRTVYREQIEPPSQNKQRLYEKYDISNKTETNREILITLFSA